MSLYKTEHWLTLSFCALLGLQSGPAQAEESAFSVCAALAQSHVSSTTSSSDYVHETASNKWKMCQSMLQMANNIQSSDNARKKILEGKASISYGLLGISPEFSDQDLSSASNFQLALRRVESHECGSAASAAELERNFVAQGTQYFNTSPDAVECLKALKDHPIQFTPPMPGEPTAAFTIAPPNASTAVNVEISYEPKLVVCQSGGAMLGTKAFCDGRHKADPNCLRNKFLIDSQGQLSAECSSLKEDVAAVVHVAFNGSILRVPVPVRQSAAARKADQMAELRNRLAVLEVTVSTMKLAMGAVVTRQFVGNTAEYFTGCLAQLDSPSGGLNKCMMLASRYCTDTHHKGGYWTGGVKDSGAARTLDVVCID